MGRVDVALEEFKALRAEILVHQQAQAAIVGVALTATAVIGGLAFGDGATGTSERHEILLVLPIVLGGLGLAYLSHSLGAMHIGAYIRERLWTSLQTASPGDHDGEISVIHSWEAEAALWRGLEQSFLSIRGALSWLPGMFVFGIPGAAALAFNWDASSFGTSDVDGRLVAVWWVDAVSLTLALVLLIGAGRSAAQRPGVADERVAVDVIGPPGVKVTVVLDFPDGTRETRTATVE